MFYLRKRNPIKWPKTNKNTTSKPGTSEKEDEWAKTYSRTFEKISCWAKIKIGCIRRSNKEEGSWEENFQVFLSPESQ